jgi:hypothetical protein
VLTLLVLDEGAHEIVERKRIDNSIGVNHEKVLYEDSRASAASRSVLERMPDLMVHFELSGRHGRVEVDAVEETHEEHLRVTLAAVAWARAFCRLANLDDDLERSKLARAREGRAATETRDVRNDVTSRFV